MPPGYLNLARWLANRPPKMQKLACSGAYPRDVETGTRTRICAPTYLCIFDKAVGVGTESTERGWLEDVMGGTAALDRSSTSIFAEVGLPCVSSLQGRYVNPEVESDGPGRFLLE